MPGAAATHIPRTRCPGSPNPTALDPAILGFDSSWPQHPLLAVRPQTALLGWGPALLIFVCPLFAGRRWAAEPGLGCGIEKGWFSGRQGLASP